MKKSLTKLFRRANCGVVKDQAIPEWLKLTQLIAKNELFACMQKGPNLRIEVYLKLRFSEVDIRKHTLQILRRVNKMYNK